VAHDNLASMRVLEKCGFEMCGVTEGFSYLRRMGVVEFVFVLDDPVLTQAATPGWDPAP
jgi:RimJ/RimL family protein N-acetyltransferase